MRTQGMTHERHILRAKTAMGAGASPEDAAKALMDTHVYPETAYLAVMAATLLLQDELLAGVNQGEG